LSELAVAAFIACWIIVIGDLAITSAAPAAQISPPPNEQTAPSAGGRFEIQAVSAATGNAIEGATAEWSLRINGGRFTRTTSATGPNGLAVLEWPKGATVNALQVTVRKAGFAPYMIILNDSVHPIRLAATKQIRLVPGTTLGGVVKDEAGKPVSNAKVTVQAPPAEAEEPYYRGTSTLCSGSCRTLTRTTDSPPASTRTAAFAWTTSRPVNTS
jgi:hypothetical protein